jgi:hypothetical protein
VPRPYWNNVEPVFDRRALYGTTPHVELITALQPIKLLISMSGIGQKWSRNFEQRYKCKLWAKCLAEGGWARRSFHGQEISTAHTSDAPFAPSHPENRQSRQDR